MHVFVTGGTGTIGSAVVAELLTHGHTVLALARSGKSAQTLDDAGAAVLRGRLPRRWDATLAGRARLRRGHTLPPGPGVGAGRHVVARGRRRG